MQHAAAQSAIGSAIRARRLSAGLSASALAERAGIARTHVSTIEAGGRPNPRLYTVAAIARVLGCTVDALVLEAAAAGRRSRKPRLPRH